MEISQRKENESGRRYAHRVLENNILNCILKPGEDINEKEISLSLGISRTPVREALIELGEVEIVNIYPQKGIRVSLIDDKLVEDAFFVRKSLECATAKYACTVASENGKEELEEIVSMQEFFLGKNINKLLELDDLFHATLFAICGKSRIYKMMKKNIVHFDRIKNMSAREFTSIRKDHDSNMIKDHRAIVSALLDGDGNRASVKMEEHIDRYGYNKEFLKANFSEYF